MADRATSFLPDHDGTRLLTVGDPDDPSLRHFAVVGDTYTFLIEGDDTDARYAVIDMLIPAGGGPPPHRHDFEEMFHVLEGRVEVTLRGQKSTAEQGATVNIPANVPHHFKNSSDQPIRLLCMVSPSGLEKYFAAFGDEVGSRTSPAPDLSEDEQQKRMAKAKALAPKYRIENL
ncbi:MAG: cupin domain-containing protein [Solirubrobacterales bacterium]|nr:cupin domain-containing protein [Solirubrobacterales bacterium]